MAAERFSHFSESSDAIGSIQTHFPSRTVHFYDWGLSHTLQSIVQKRCNVILKPFSFDEYPHLANLSKFWEWRYQIAKAFVITESLGDYPAVFWVDASTRFLMIMDNLEHVYKLAEENKGVVLFSAASTTGLPVTPPGMYEYLPTDMDGVKRSAQLQTGL